MSLATLATLAALAASPVVAFFARLTAILALGFVVTTLMHRASAAMRHLVWTLTMAAALVLAPATVIAPRLDIPLPGELAARILDPASFPAEASLSPVTRAEPGATRPDDSSAPVPFVLRSRAAAPISAGELTVVIWAAGTLLLLAWYALGHIGLGRLARRATPIESDRWAQDLAAVAGQMQVRRTIRLAQSAEIGAPITWGAAQPVILVPRNAVEWSDDRRRVVLLHEVAHIARLDYLTQSMGAALCALYWAHPLAWLAARRMRAESERAADDRVIAAGTLPTDYATHLLNVARGAIELRLTGAVAIGMARKSTLEGRMLALLDDRRDRRSTSRRGQALAAVFGFTALVAVASIHPVSAGAQDRRVQELRAQAERATVERRAADEGLQGQSISRTIDAGRQTALNIELRSGGTLRIRGWDDPRVRVVARTKSENGTLDKLTLATEGNQVVLRTVPAPRGSDAEYAFEVMVPKKFNVVLESSGGAVSILGLEGTVRGNTADGEVTLEHLNGRAELSTGRGEVRVMASRLEGTVTTSEGDVRFTAVEGGLKGVTSKGEFVKNAELEKAKAYTVRTRDGKEYTATLNEKAQRAKLEMEAFKLEKRKPEYSVEKPFAEATVTACDPVTGIPAESLREIAARFGPKVRAKEGDRRLIGIIFDSTCQISAIGVGTLADEKLTVDEALARVMEKKLPPLSSSGFVPFDKEPRPGGPVIVYAVLKPRE